MSETIAYTLLHIAFPGTDDTTVVFLFPPLPDCRALGFTLKVGDKGVSMPQMISLTQEEHEAAKANNAYEVRCAKFEFRSLPSPLKLRRDKTLARARTMDARFRPAGFSVAGGIGLARRSRKA